MGRLVRSKRFSASCPPFTLVPSLRLGTPKLRLCLETDKSSIMVDDWQRSGEKRRSRFGGEHS